jgi:general nucleoside transport system permease protein
MINDSLIIVVAAQMVTAAVPLILAGLGELTAQRAGVMNVGIEGLLLTGCVSGFVAAAMSGHGSIGVLTAVVAAMALASIFAWATVMMRADQIVTGMAINLMAVGGSGTAWMLAQAHGYAELPTQAGFARGIVPWITSETQQWLSSLPLLGPLLFDHYGMAIVAMCSAIGIWWILKRTRVGLIIHGLGENPNACAMIGINVRWWRCGLIVLAGAAAGLAGAYLSLMRVHGFSPLMTGGMGFVILALVIFARWQVGGLIAACMGFGLIDAIQSLLQGRGGNQLVSHHFFQALPFIIAFVALLFMRRGHAGPTTLGQAWPNTRV